MSGKEPKRESERERKKLLARHFFPSDTFACFYKWWSLSKCVKEFFIPLTVERGGWCDLLQFDSRVLPNRFYLVTYALESSPIPLVCVCLRLFSLVPTLAVFNFYDPSDLNFWEKRSMFYSLQETTGDRVLQLTHMNKLDFGFYCQFFSHARLRPCDGFPKLCRWVVTARNK